MSHQKKMINDNRSFKEIYLRLFSYAIEYKWIITLSLFSLIILALTNAGFLSLIKQITDEGLINEGADKSLYLPLTLFFLMTIRAFSNFISSYSMRWTSRKIVEDLRNDVFKNIMLLPVKYFDDNAAGNIVSKVTYETERLSDIVIKVTLDFIKDFLSIIAILAYMFYLDWLLTLFFILLIPLFIFYLKIVSPKLRKAGKELQESMGDMTRISEEAITGNRIVKIFGTKIYEYKRFSFYSLRNRKMATKLAQLSGGNSFFVEIVSGIALGSIVYYSFNNLTVGEFTAFATALLMLLNPIRKITSANEFLQIGYSAACSVFNVIDEFKEKNNGKIKLAKIKGDIEFINLSFKYSKFSKTVLKNININIRAGEKVALVGKSGSGKSTIINLLPLFYLYGNGKILIDGYEIKKIDLTSLRNQISLVSQDTILFNDTIKKNIGYGKKYTLEEIKLAAKNSNADEFINNLENKYDEIIGDRGIKLSGGQKQRISIARAILRNTPILLLDEATSSLDSESEKHVQKALDNLMRGKTSIIVAHRLSTILNADKIIVIDSGNVVEQGTHHELIKLNGFYSKLYEKGFN